MDCSMPGFSVLHYLLEFTHIHVHWVSDAIQPSHPLSPPSPPALNLSQHQGLFQWVGSLHQVVKGLELQLQHQSFPMNIQGWFPLGLSGWISLLSKGLFKSLLQHHSPKASILQCSAFFMVQLSHVYMTTGKTIALTIQTFVGKVMSLLFNKLSSLVSFSSKPFSLQCEGKWDEIMKSPFWFCQVLYQQSWWGAWPWLPTASSCHLVRSGGRKNDHQGLQPLRLGLSQHWGLIAPWGGKEELSSPTFYQTLFWTSRFLENF